MSCWNEVVSSSRTYDFTGGVVATLSCYTYTFTREVVGVTRYDKFFFFAVRRFELKEAYAGCKTYLGAQAGPIFPQQKMWQQNRSLKQRASTATKMVKAGGAESAPAVLFTAVRIKPERVKSPWQSFLHESTCSTSLNMKKSVSFHPPSGVSTQRQHNSIKIKWKPFDFRWTPEIKKLSLFLAAMPAACRQVAE